MQISVADNQVRVQICAGGDDAGAVLELQASGTNTMLVLGIVFLAVAACLALPGFIAAATGMLKNFAGN